MPINRSHPRHNSAPSTTRLTWAGKAASEELPKGVALTPVEVVLPVSTNQVIDLRQGTSSEPAFGGRLICGDNLTAGATLLAEPLRARLIYLDPPFESQTDYSQTVSTSNGAPPIVRHAYSDSWPGGLDDYLSMLYPRLQLARRLLSDDGSLYLHLDWRTVHYVKLLLDEIFGRQNFRNEIVWRRNPNLGRKAGAAQWGRVTDTILFYSAGPAVIFHRPLLTRPADRRSLRIDPATHQAYKTAPPGDYTHASLAALEAQGRIYRTRSGKVRVRYNLAQGPSGEWLEQVPVDSLWLDVPDMMHVSPDERTDYATQKPLALLKRLIAASSDSGDLVADLFCGSGTTLVAAEQLNRRWLGIDRSPVAIGVARARLVRAGARPFQMIAPLDGAVTPASLSQDEIGLQRTVLDDGTCEWQLTLQPRASLDQVADWSVDWQFEGLLFRAMWQGVRTPGKSPEPVPARARAWTAADWHGRVAVRVTDLLGVLRQVVFAV